MPIPLTALLAATLQQLHSAASDQAALARAADLLARAAGAGVSSWEFEPDRLLVNGVPVPNSAPGVAMVRAALAHHHIRLLKVPGHTDAAHWTDLAAALDMADGLYPNAEQFTHALQAAVPGVEVIISADVTLGDETETLSGRDDTDRIMANPFTESEPGLLSREADRAALSVRLDPLIEAGIEAVGRWDWVGISSMLLELHDLEMSSNDAERWIIGQERHRVVTPHVVRAMVRELPAHNAISPVTRAFAYLGSDGVEAILEALTNEQHRPVRHSYVAALETIEHADAALMEALTPSTPATVLPDVIDVVGRRRIEGAVPMLGTLRTHREERVRASALRALENIGTAEAIAALRSR